MKHSCKLSNTLITIPDEQVYVFSSNYLWKFIFSNYNGSLFIFDVILRLLFHYNNWYLSGGGGGFHHLARKRACKSPKRVFWKKSTKFAF
jgi:hypothetical protein